MLSNVTFIEEGHKYLDKDNREVISVTQIIKEEGLTDYSFCTEEHMQKGTGVHLTTALDDTGVLDEASVPEYAVNPLRAWRQFKADYQPEFLDIEVPIMDYGLNLAGTPDRIFRYDGKIILADLKFTDTLRATTAIQVALYRFLCEKLGQKIDQRWAIRLTKDGKCKPFIYDKNRLQYQNDLAEGMQCLYGHRLRLKYNPKGAICQN